MPQPRCTGMTHVSQRQPLTPEQRQHRDRERAAEAVRAMQEHQEAEKAFYANRDRLKALRLSREAEANKVEKRFAGAERS